MTDLELKSAIEAILYVTEDPVPLKTLRELFPETLMEQIVAVVEALRLDYQSAAHGIEVREVAHGLKMSTKPEHHEILKQFARTQRPPTRLSISALETLACIAYKQPITLPEIQEIRGVNASSVLHTLLEKKLITTTGRKAVMGRPILYRTTQEFLIHFGLKDLSELPTLKEFEEIASRASLSASLSTEGDATNPAPESALDRTPPLPFADPKSESLQTISDSGEDGSTQ